MANIELQRTETLCSDYRGSDAKGGEKLKYDTGLTDLHVACYRGNLSAVCELVVHCSATDCDSVDFFGDTPFHKACQHGNPEIVKILLDKGATIDVGNKESTTPLHVACKEGHVDVVKELLKPDRGDVTSMIAARDLAGNTPIHCAVESGVLEIVKVLLSLSADPNVKNIDGIYPIHVAATRGYADIAKALLQHHNEMKDTKDDREGNTPLHLAAKYGRVKVADYLIDVGAEMDARNSELWTPMDCAANEGHVGVISLLVKAGVPLNSTNTDPIAHTPLVLACKSGHASAVELLLKNGADVSVKDKETGFNCLDIAIENGHQEVAMAIVKSDSWKKALRNAVGHRTPMRRMIQKFPDVAHAVLERCISDNVTEKNPNIMSSRNYEVTFDFEFIEDWRTPSHTRLKRRLNRMNPNLMNTNISDFGPRKPTGTSSITSTLEPQDKEKQSDNMGLEREEELATKWKPEGLFKQHHPLNLMVKYNRGDLLRHPVVYALLDRKWRRYGRKLFIINLSLYVLFLSFLTLYALSLPRPDHVYCRDYSVLGNVSSLPRVNETCPWDNLTFAQGDPTIPTRYVHRVFLYIAAAIVLVLAAIRLVLEFLQFVERRLRYLLNADNYLEIPTYIFAIIFVIQFGMNCWCPSSWQWQLGALSVFFAWINFILFIKRFPLLGIYVLMYSTIMHTFFRVVIIAILFVIAFSLAFYMILYRAVLNSGILNTSPFRTPGLSIHKTMTMTTGEFDYDTIFGNSEDDKDQLTEFAGLAYFLWIVFLIAMPILLVNLLVGLAVDDAKSIQERAQSRRIELKVNHALQVQELMRHFLRQGPDIGLKTLHPNRKLRGWEWFKDKVWGVERWDSLDSLQKYRKPNLSVVGHIKVHTEELASEIKEIKNKITSIEQLLQKMAKKQGIHEAE